MLAMNRQSRTAVLTLLVIPNLLNLLAQVFLLIANDKIPGHDLLAPAQAVITGFGALVAAGYIWILVRRLPAQAATLLRPGFVLLAVGVLAAAAVQLLIRAQAARALRALHAFPVAQSLLVSQQQLIETAATIGAVAGVIAAAGWLVWVIQAAPGPQTAGEAGGTAGESPEPEALA